MAAPSFTPTELAAIEAQRDLFLAGAANADAQIAGVDQAIADAEALDDAFKVQFDYHDDVIRAYETERRYMDGMDIEEIDYNSPQSPPVLQSYLVEQDLLDFISGAGRLLYGDGSLDTAFTPNRNASDNASTPNTYDIWDGLPLALVDDINETSQFGVQDEIIGVLQGQTAITLVATTTTTTLDINSTTVQLTAAAQQTIAPSDLIIIDDATDASLIEVITSTESGSGPYLYDITLRMIAIKSSVTLAIGAFAGINTGTAFTNGERSTKTAAPSWRQSLLDGCLEILDNSLDTRKSALQSELSAVQSNENSNVPASVETNINTSISAIDGFLGVTPPSTIDISDTGITALNSEKTTRLAQIASRIAATPAEIAAEDNYDNRYTYAVNRAHLGNGTLTIVEKLEGMKAQLLVGKGAATEGAARYNALLP